MSGVQTLNFDAPDETRAPEKTRVEVVLARVARVALGPEPRLERPDLRRRPLEPRVGELARLHQLEDRLAEIAVGLAELAFVLDVLDALPRLDRRLPCRLLCLVEKSHCT